ncbi:MAG: TonB-dependent receptor, partial [Bacteroidota bacterium]
MKRALAIILFLCPVALAQIPRVIGTVLDADSREPVVGAVVRLVPGATGSVTGEDGRFEMTDIRVGAYQIVISHVGYRTKRQAEFRVHTALDTALIVMLREEAINEGPVVVTASRRAQALADVPVSMATMEAEEIASRAVVNADEAIRKVSGVSMIEDQINIRGSSGYSRGVGSRVLLLVDGLPMLTGDTGEINWETIPVHQIERIEVVKGAGSALYGSSALGGVVNIITKEIERETQVAIQTLAGVYDRFPNAEWNWSSRMRRTSAVSTTVTGRPAEIGYLVGLQQTMDEGYRQNDVAHRYGLFGKVSWHPPGGGALKVTLNAVRRLNGNYFWWKSLREPALPPEDQQQRWVESTRGNVSVEYRPPTSEGSSVVLRGQYYGNDWLDRIRRVVGNRSRSDQCTVEGQLTQVVGDRSILIGGVAGHGDRVRSNIFGTHPGVGMAVFVQSEYRATEEISMNAGLRWDWQKVSVLAGASQLDPRAAVTYRPAPLTTFRASWGTGFRYPSIGELYTSVTTGFGSVNVVPNPALKP